MQDYLVKRECRIHSLDGKMAEATIIWQLGDNDYLADYNGVQCHAIFNHFNGCYYVDDKYGIIKDKEPKVKDHGAR